MFEWREKVVAPVAVVAIHQAGLAIDRVREPVPTDWYAQAKTYATYGPAVALTAWNLMYPRMPIFLEEMVAPALTIGLDDLGARLVAWATKAPGNSEAAVREAARIVAEARAKATGNKGGSVSQSIARDERLLA